MDNLNEFIKETVLFYLNGLRASWHGLKKFWYIPLVLFIAIGGYVYSKKSTAQYTGKVVYTYNYMDALFYAKTYEELQELIGSEDLSKALGIPQEAASTIKGIEVKDYKGDHVSRMQTVKGPIYLHLNLSNKIHGKQIEEGFTNYINNHPFVEKEIQSFQKLNMEKVNYLSKELGILDSLKRNDYGTSSNKQSSSIDLAPLFQESEKKFQELIDLKSSLEKDVAIEVFKPLLLESSSSSKSKTIIKWFVVWLALSVILCYIIGIVAEVNKENE